MVFVEINKKRQGEYFGRMDLVKQADKMKLPSCEKLDELRKFHKKIYYNF